MAFDDQHSPPKRSTSIVILVVFLLIQGVGTFGYGIFLGLYNGWVNFKGASFFNFVPIALVERTTSGVVLIPLSLLMVIVALACYRLKSWAWLAAITIQGVNLLIGLIDYILKQPNFVALAFGVVLVFYLNQQDVRDVYNR